MTIKSNQSLASGHRSRLRERFMTGGNSALADYELLEMVLFAAHPRGDVKPLAKQLIQHFGSFAGVIEASPEALSSVENVGDSAIAAIKLVGAAAERLLKQQASEGPIIQSWTALLDYCKVAMAAKKVEEFRILFLDAKHKLIGDEVQNRGTIDHTAVYPREVLKRALEFHASAIILVHNHPSGDPTPSKADIDMTKAIVQAARALNISVHDHLIIGKKGHYSFKSNGLI
ncbi:MAG: DNA repair protein RadC [Rickettsiales bacterium]